MSDWSKIPPIKQFTIKREETAAEKAEEERKVSKFEKTFNIGDEGNSPKNDGDFFKKEKEDTEFNSSGPERGSSMGNLEEYLKNSKENQDSDIELGKSNVLGDFSIEDPPTPDIEENLRIELKCERCNIRPAVRKVSEGSKKINLCEECP
ncbi:hypothetical protein GN156_00020 [bacterium LRH843]|nr:hypothetical protein [bacterium LRH843]